MVFFSNRLCVVVNLIYNLYNATMFLALKLYHCWFSLFTQIGALSMGIVDHELKKQKMWVEELNKKKRADILALINN